MFQYRVRTRLHVCRHVYVNVSRSNEYVSQFLNAIHHLLITIGKIEICQMSRLTEQTTAGRASITIYYLFLNRVINEIALDFHVIIVRGWQKFCSLFRSFKTAIHFTQLHRRTIGFVPFDSLVIVGGIVTPTTTATATATT